MPHLTRDAKADVQTKGGGSFSYAYLTLEKLLEQTVPILNKHGLALLQYPCSEDGRYALKTELRHSSGDAVSTVFPLAVAADAPSQTVGSALTYARRYSLLSMLGLSADEDDDGHAAQEKPPVKEEDKPSQAQHALLAALLNELEEKKPREDTDRTYVQDAQLYVKSRWGKHSRSQLTKAEMSDLIDEVQGWVDMIDVPFTEETAA